MTIHLFKKDMRRLWMLALAVTALAFAQAYMQGRQLPRFDELSKRWRELAGMLGTATMLGWAFLLVLAVQEDGLAGSDEDWLTRPIGWRCLLQAKLLFLAAVVMLPMALSGCYVVWAQGFSPWEYGLGLLARVLVITAVLLLPAIGLAAVTKNVAQVVLGGFLFLMALTAVESSGLLSTENMGELFWVRASAGHLLICSAAVAITVWQYATRRTLASRVAAATATLLVLVGPASVTRAGARAVDQLRWNEMPGFQVRMAEQAGTVPALRTPSTWEAGNTSVWVALPLEVSGIQEPERIQSMGGTLELVAPDGERIESSQSWPENLRREVSGDGHIRHWLLVAVPKGYYGRHLEQALGVRGEISFGILRAGTPVRLRPGQPVTEVPGVGRCRAYFASITGLRQLYLECRRPIRVEASLEAVLHRPQIPDVHSERQMSGRGMFEPLAAQLDFNPMVESFATWIEPSSVGEVVATPLTRVELARRKLSVDGVRLKDFYVGH